jgi:hypothetical protein
MIQRAFLIFLIISPTWPATDSREGLKAADGDAAALVHKIIQNEINMDVADNSHWAYLRFDGKRSQVYKIVETNTVKLKMLLSENGNPLSFEERSDEIAKLKDIAADIHEQQKDKFDAEKAYQLMKELQPAFIYRIERTAADQTVVRFYPNPDYEPETREATVFHAMSGTITFNTKEKRLIEIQGHLIKDVKLGLGLLADLKQGGYFYVRKAPVAPNCWKIVDLKIQIEGKALFFKSISTRQSEKHSNFRRLPDNFSAKDGISFLLRQGNP